MTVSRIVEILIDNYSLSELEDQLEVTLVELAEGLEIYVENNFDAVKKMLEDDLFI